MISAVSGTEMHGNRFIRWFLVLCAGLKWNLSRAEAEDIAQDVVEKLIKNALKWARKRGKEWCL